MDERPTVSVIIRNRNESTYLERVLSALTFQDAGPVEVILVDNESDDDSVAVGRRFGAKVYTLERGKFTYGRALNVGIREASGEVCVILSAHSLPLGAGFLRECVKPFADGRVAAVRCVLVGKGTDLTRWLNPELLDDSFDVDAVFSKGPLASGCAIRRRVWEELPFDEEMTAAEDKLWGLEAVRRGHVIYSPAPAFYCYMRKRPPRERLRKSDREHLESFRITGTRGGFSDRSTIGAISDALKGVFWLAPCAALSVANDQILKAYLRCTFGRRVRRRREREHVRHDRGRPIRVSAER